MINLFGTFSDYVSPLKNSETNVKYVQALAQFLVKSRQKFTSVFVWTILTCFQYIAVDVLVLEIMNSVSDNFMVNHTFDFYDFLNEDQASRVDTLYQLFPHFSQVMNTCLSRHFLNPLLYSFFSFLVHHQ